MLNSRITGEMRADYGSIWSTQNDLSRFWAVFWAVPRELRNDRPFRCTKSQRKVNPELDKELLNQAGLRMRYTWKVMDYDHRKIHLRYVRYFKSSNAFYFCEIGSDPNIEMSHGDVDGSELPNDVRLDAVKRDGWSYAEWPLENK